MQIHTTVDSLRAARRAAGRVALVPTMGNLHEGHITLMRQAGETADEVIASIFVNRLQFGPKDDFAKYPRTLDADCEKLEAAGVAHLFTPDESVMYPTRQTYHVDPDPAQVATLEGSFRPGHFRGVATVVLKLLNIVQPDVALFGKKDYQQLMILRNMVNQLAIPVQVLPGETVRADDGLALSSRNRYLSPDERKEACRIYQCLTRIRDAIRNGNTHFDSLERAAMSELAANRWQPDYISVRRQSDLQVPQKPNDALVVLAAARLGTTRLIDNLEI